MEGQGEGTLWEPLEVRRHRIDMLVGHPPLSIMRCVGGGHTGGALDPIALHDDDIMATSLQQLGGRRGVSVCLCLRPINEGPVFVMVWWVDGLIQVIGSGRRSPSPLVSQSVSQQSINQPVRCLVYLSSLLSQSNLGTALSEYPCLHGWMDGWRDVNRW